MTAATDPDFEDAALAEFVRVLGASTLAMYRAAVDELGPGMVAMALWSLDLSENDQRIFRAVARRLQRDIEAEQPA